MAFPQNFSYNPTVPFNNFPNFGVGVHNTPPQILPPTYTPAIEDVQEIISPIPRPDQLPTVYLPPRVNAPSVGPTIIQGNPTGLIVNGASTYQPSGSFVLPPSIVSNNPS